MRTLHMYATQYKKWNVKKNLRNVPKSKFRIQTASHLQRWRSLWWPGSPFGLFWISFLERKRIDPLTLFSLFSILKKKLSFMPIFYSISTKHTICMKFQKLFDILCNFLFWKLSFFLIWEFGLFEILNVQIWTFYFSWLGNPGEDVLALSLSISWRHT